MKRKTLILSVAVLAAFTMAAQEKKDVKQLPAKSTIIHPEMTVSAGTYDKPITTIGKPGAGWSVTTVAAGVDGKPQPGKPMKVVGEVVDFSCYLQLGKHGGKHADPCGKKCLQNGAPIGVLTREGTLYMIMPEEHDPRRDGGVDAKAWGSEHIGQIVEVNGVAASVGGYHGLYVQGLTK